MADKKPGRVIRVDDLTWAYVQSKAKKSEKISALMRRLIGLPSKKGIVDRPVFYVLPSDMYSSIEEARGAVILKSIKNRQVISEQPIEAREVI